MEDQEQPPTNPLAPIDFSSIQIVPESHSWVDSHELSVNMIDLDKKLSLPLIDLLDDGASELIGRACEQWGIFQLINHGIPETLLAELEDETQRLFALPTSQKVKTLISSGNLGGYGLGGSTVKIHEKRFWQEGYTIVGSPIDNAKKLWPSDYKRFCDVIEKYQNEMKNLSDRLLRLILKSLEILEDEEILKMLSEASGLLLNSYPPCPEINKAVGIAAHTDTSFLTIIHQALSDGLEIFKDGVGWVLMSPMSGALIVHVGDLLDILSNNQFLSIVHRVVIKKKNVQRMSFAYFLIPSLDLCISPFVKPMSKSPQLPLYRRMTVREYAAIKENNKGKGLSTIKI